jgi:hypothetical protein
MSLQLGPEVSRRHVVKLIAIVQLHDGVVLDLFVIARTVNFAEEQIATRDTSERLDLSARHFAGIHLEVLMVDLNVDVSLDFRRARAFHWILFDSPMFSISRA